MPKRKVTKKTSKKTAVSQKRNLLQQIKITESYVSLFLGAAVVLIVFIIGFLFLKNSGVDNRRIHKQTSSAHTELSVPQVTEKGNAVNGKYTVKTGDDLWSISEKIYGSGYNWTDIAKANNISNPGLIFTGQQLDIPNEKPIIVTAKSEESKIQQIGMSQAEGAILGNTYTVVKGDDLWNIAVRAYGDGYKYVEIIKANNLKNPSLIFSGNILKIPR